MDEPLARREPVLRRVLSAPLHWLSDLPLSRMLPLDLGEVARALLRLNAHLARHPGQLARHGFSLARDQASILLWNLRRIADPCAPEPIAAGAKDRRFADPAWQQHPLFSSLKQSYLSAARELAQAAQQLDGTDARGRHRTQFFLRQLGDALCPANLPLLNPAVLRETFDSGGDNLRRGFRRLRADLKRGEIDVGGQGAFKVGENLALSPGKVVLRNELAELIQYAPATATTHRVPMLLIPPWINKFYVLDLKPGKSLVEFLVGQGHTVFLISWRNPGAELQHIGMEDYLRLGPLACIEAIKRITGAPKLNLAGYCLGGTLLSIALAWLAAKKDASVASATFFTALQDFEEVGETAIFISEDQLAGIDQRMRRKGYLDASEMGAIFRLMRSNDLIWSFVIGNYFLGKEPLPQDLLFWSADGTRMPRAMHSYYLRNMYLENNLVKRGRLTFLGEPIDLGRVRCPTYVVAGTEDHIVPWTSAHRARAVFGGKPRLVLSHGGHITSIVNPPAAGRGHFFTAAGGGAGADWLQAAQRHEGSWWPDWVKWLRRVSGAKGAPPAMGASLGEAPGDYVFET